MTTACELHASGAIELYFYDELSPRQREAVEGHLPSCGHCRTVLAELGVIRQALAQSNASVTKAALLLGMSYQGLAYVIASRHPDLLKERSPVRKRVRKDRDVKGDQEAKPE